MMYQSNNFYYSNQHAQQYSDQLASEIERQSVSPASSDGLGSSIASSPSPSNSSSPRISSPSVNSLPYGHNSTPSAYIYLAHQHPVYAHNYNQYTNQQPTNYYNPVPYPAQENYNYQFPARSNQSYLEDSNYNSRNNSLNQTNLNESCNGLSHSIKPAPVKPKPLLKFSIDSILGNVNKEEKPSPDQEKHDVSSESTGDKNMSRKRKNNAKSSVDKSSNKRLRTIFTQEQLDRLEVEFMRQQYMVGSERSYLADSMNLSESQVKIWFQNRRIKWRKTQYGGEGDKSVHDESLNDSICDE